MCIKNLFCLILYKFKMFISAVLLADLRQHLLLFLIAVVVLFVAAIVVVVATTFIGT